MEEKRDQKELRRERKKRRITNLGGKKRMK